MQSQTELDKGKRKHTNMNEKLITNWTQKKRHPETKNAIVGHTSNIFNGCARHDSGKQEVTESWGVKEGNKIL